MSISQSNPEDYPQFIKAIEEKMNESVKEKKYAQAQKMRQQIEKQKQLWKNKIIQDMNMRHFQRISNIQSTYANLLLKLRQQFNQKQRKRQEESTQQALKKIEERKKQQLQQLRRRRQEQPIKIRQSYQLTNLRQIQAQMAKQKDFIQAGLVQQKIQYLYNKQMQRAIRMKQDHWNQLEANLIQKYMRQKHYYDKNMNEKRQQQKYELQKQQNLLKVKLAKQIKQANSFLQRQILSYKMQFSTKGGRC